MKTKHARIRVQFMTFCIGLPFGLFSAAVASDTIRIAGGGRDLVEVSFWLVAAGLAATLFAVTIVPAELLGTPTKARGAHYEVLACVTNVIVFLLLVASWFLRYVATDNAIGLPFILASTALAVSLVVGCLGGAEFRQMLVRVGRAITFVR